MGQGQSSSTPNPSIFDGFPPIVEELLNLTYEQLEKCIQQLNVLAKKHVDSEDNYLIFDIEGMPQELDIFWKALIVISCLKIDRKTDIVIGKRRFNLPTFWRVFKTMMVQYSTAEQCSHSVTASEVFYDINGLSEQNSLDSQRVCSICFERNHDVLLPCTHAYCSECIEKWKRSNDTCPMCRTTIDSDEDWELTNIPKYEEIQQEICSTLSNLTEEAPPPRFQEQVHHA